MKKREFNSDFALFSDTKEIVSRLKEFINEKKITLEIFCEKHREAVSFAKIISIILSGK